MSPSVRKLLYCLFKMPSMKPDGSTIPPQQPLKRHFVLMRVHVGENGLVKTATIKMSCGDKNIDQMALTEMKSHQFAQPRVGHRAVAQWHNMRWEVPAHLRI